MENLEMTHSEAMRILDKVRDGVPYPIKIKTKKKHKKKNNDNRVFGKK
jgi:hypothetical protein